MRHESRKFRRYILTLSCLAIAACGGEASRPSSGIDFNNEGYSGFTETHFDLLAGACTYSSGNMTLTVGSNETAYLYLRATDGMVVANASTSTGGECTVAATGASPKQITITGTSSGKVILDYINGVFGVATAAYKAAMGMTPASGGPNTILNFSGSGNTLKIRGTVNADRVVFGTDQSASPHLTYGSFVTSTSPTVAPKAATFPDMKMNGIDNIVVSVGAGNDYVSGQGGGSIGGATALPLVLEGAISFTVYGGANDDTITSGATSTGGAYNQLFGEDGNDLFIENCSTATKVGGVAGTQTGFGKDIIVGGNNVDTVDFSCRTAPVSVNLAVGTPASAATATLTAKAKASLHDNDRFTIDDHSNPAKTFEYWTTAPALDSDVVTVVSPLAIACGDTLTVNDGSNPALVLVYKTAAMCDNSAAVTAGDVEVDISALATATQVASTTSTAVTAGGLAVTSTPSGATVTITATMAHNLTVTAGGSGLSRVHTARFAPNAMGDVIIDARTLVSVDQVASATLAAINALSGSSLNVSGSIANATSVITLTATVLGATADVAVTDTSSVFAATMHSAGVDNNISGAGDDGDQSGSHEHDDIDVTVENVIGGSGADTLDASQAPLVQHVLQGMAGNDVLIGAALADTLYGGPGSDTLQGGGGADFLFGGDSGDVLTGGLGADRIDGDGANCVKAVAAAPAAGITQSAVPYISSVCTATFATASTTAGVNTLDYSDHVTAVTIDMTGAIGASPNYYLTLTLGGGEVDTLCTVAGGTMSSPTHTPSASIISGGMAGDTITCRDGMNCTVHGNGGSDTITGGNGNDTLYGDSGDDTVSGGAGSDVVTGGAGVDTVNGGTGNDLVDTQDGEIDTLDCGGDSLDLLVSDPGDHAASYVANVSGCIP